MPTYLNHMAQWKSEVGAPCGVIIDPFTYRSAELFLLGKDAVPAAEADQIWSLLANNIGALQSFLDALILRRQLPMIAYNLSFYETDDPGGTPRLLELCNQGDDILLDIRLGDPAYGPLKESAVQILNDNRPQVTPEKVAKLAAELSAFDYRWTPDLKAVQGFAEADARTQRVLTYLFGAVLFGHYAQAAEADELINAKRSELLTQATTRRAETRARLAKELFGGLEAIARAGRDCVTLVYQPPWTPSFLPYLLLQEPKTPGDLLTAALTLRDDPTVEAYRDWFTEIAAHMALGRRPPEASAKALGRLQAQLEQRIEGARSFGIKATIAFIGFLVPTLKLDVEKRLAEGETWGWMTDRLPGNRYRKILSELVMAERRYEDLAAHLYEIWR